MEFLLCCVVVPAILLGMGIVYTALDNRLSTIEEKIDKNNGENQWTQ